MYIFKLLLLFQTMDIILFYNFNSLIWLTGIVEVVSTCSRQPKLITCSKNDNNNYNVPFLHVFNWKSNKHKQELYSWSLRYFWCWVWLINWIIWSIEKQGQKNLCKQLVCALLDCPHIGMWLVCLLHIRAHDRVSYFTWESTCMIPWASWSYHILFLNASGLNGLAQAKIIKKPVILFWLIDMTIWCRPNRLELQEFFNFCAAHLPVIG